jgi:hypothetical protein
MLLTSRRRRRGRPCSDGERVAAELDDARDPLVLVVLATFALAVGQAVQHHAWPSAAVLTDRRRRDPLRQ